MTEQEPEDTCRPVEVDGEIIDVFGREEMTEEDRGHFAEIVRAAKRKAEADDRARFAELRQHGLKARHEQRLENATYTAVEVKALTKTAADLAYALGRKETAEEIAKALEKDARQCPPKTVAAGAFGRAARIAREIGKGDPT